MLSTVKSGNIPMFLSLLRKPGGDGRKRARAACCKLGRGIRSVDALQDLNRSAA
jgi:hypothetical protein